MNKSISQGPGIDPDMFGVNCLYNPLLRISIFTFHLKSKSKQFSLIACFYQSERILDENYFYQLEPDDPSYRDPVCCKISLVLDDKTDFNSPTLGTLRFNLIYTPRLRIVGETFC